MTPIVRSKITYYLSRLRFDDRRGHSAEVALARYGRWAVPGLLEVLRTGYPVARFRAAYALGKSRDSRAIEPLERAATTDPDSRVRYDAIIALRQLGNALAIHSLRRIAANPDVDDAERAEAQFGVEQLKQSSSDRP